MTSKNNAVAEITSFIDEWENDDQLMKKWFRFFFNVVREMENVELQFTSRPGVSYSMRPKHKNQKDRDLFAIIDVIDDTDRWLSVCFYEDMITDPEGRGELIPGGLAGSDGYCFDMFEDDEDLGRYLADRLGEALGAAA